jgi:hypothetical protein
MCIPARTIPRPLHDGSSMENAIVNDARGESEGVRAEYR